MYAVSAGAGSAGAGLVTGSLMLTTVLAEFASPRLLGRFGYRAVFAAGALLLGGPAPALLPRTAWSRSSRSASPAASGSAWPPS